jgi:hypothetical protein
MGKARIYTLDVQTTEQKNRKPATSLEPFVQMN